MAYIFNYFADNCISVLKLDTIFTTIKLVLLLVLSLSFILYLYFLHNYYIYYMYNNCYSMFGVYNLLPKIFQKFFFSFELSIDLFGIIILLLSYFVGILSLLALDNRIF